MMLQHLSISQSLVIAVRIPATWEGLAFVVGFIVVAGMISNVLGGKRK